MVDKVIVLGSFEMFGESEGGADPAVVVQDLPRDLPLVSHALDGRTTTVDIAIAGHEGAGDSENTEGELVMESKNKIVWSWLLDLCFSAEGCLSSLQS